MCVGRWEGVLLREAATDGGGRTALCILRRTRTLPMIGLTNIASAGGTGNRRSWSSRLKLSKLSMPRLCGTRRRVL